MRILPILALLASASSMLFLVGCCCCGGGGEKTACDIALDACLEGRNNNTELFSDEYWDCYGDCSSTGWDCKMEEEFGSDP